MRETIAGTWIMQIVIVFIFLMVAFLALSTNYSKAFRIKNETLSIIEKGEGITNESLTYIGNYLYNNGYRMKGTCEAGRIGLTINNVNNISYERVTNENKKYSVCIAKIKSVGPNFPNRSFYEVRLFFKFNLPIIGDITTFSVTGQTKDVTYPIDGKCQHGDFVQCESRG